MKNQTTSCYTCKNKTDDTPRPLWGVQPYRHQEHLKADKQRKNKHTNKQKQAQVAAIAYDTTVDIDDLKPQDNTTTA